MWQLVKDILSEGNAASTMRFCVIMIVTVTCFNWVLGSVAVVMGKVESAGISASEIVAVLGALSIKMGQKKLGEKGGQ